MPEGDAVWRTARKLHAALAGRVITESDLRWPSLATKDLSGRTTIEVVPRGKHLLHRIEGGLTLHSHLRMDGAWRVEPAAGGARSWRRSHRLRALIGTDEHIALGFLLGELDVVLTANEGRDLVGHLGPDLLDPQWGDGLAHEAAQRLANAPGAIGSALLDQRNLAGLGTMWASETLFLSRLHPLTPTSQVGAAVRARIVDAAHDRLERAIGSVRVPLYVYDKPRRPCERCGTAIERVRVPTVTGDEVVGRGERPTRQMFFCPRCQPAGLG